MIQVTWEKTKAYFSRKKVVEKLDRKFVQGPRDCSTTVPGSSALVFILTTAAVFILGQTVSKWKFRSFVYELSKLSAHKYSDWVCLWGMSGSLEALFDVEVMPGAYPGSQVKVFQVRRCFQRTRQGWEFHQHSIGEKRSEIKFSVDSKTSEATKVSTGYPGKL